MTIIHPARKFVGKQEDAEAQAERINAEGGRAWIEREYVQEQGSYMGERFQGWRVVFFTAEALRDGS